jgi:hypothetical protein
MLNNFLGKRFRNKRFNYEPRFYDPAKEQRLRDRMRVQSSVRRGRGGNVLLYILLLCGLLWVMVTLNA